ncbi:MAG: type II toxin-antitoxin system YafQ family toxin [Clostridiales bacterium]|nr:type II toxin-antitoxin system YafQ family toxin [Clostridiales bacterium]
MMYNIRATTKFKKDYKLIQKQGKNLKKLFDVIEKIANDEHLDKKYQDHFLSGDYEGYRECHIEPDWLLIYQINEDDIVLILSRTGSHSDLF